MAKRPAWTIQNDKIIQHEFEFTWSGGFAISQKKKNVVALHQAIFDKFNKKTLEVSTKSDDLLGTKLSAFTLKFDGYFLENIFQSSKVYEKGGPFLDLLSVEPKESKKDLRHHANGALTHFFYNNEEWKLTPTTVFYDFIYIKSVQQTFKKEELLPLYDYDFFTDIEFNPSKSVNTQGRSVAILKYLLLNDMYDIKFTNENWIDLHKKIVDTVLPIKEKDSKSKKMENLKKVAQENIEISSVGYYKTNKNNKTAITLPDTEESTFISENNIKKMTLPSKTYDDTKISLLNELVVKTIFDCSKNIKESEIGVLNFASGVQPCGRFLAGDMAQEESLAYSSNLYEKLSSEKVQIYYKSNLDVNSYANTNNMIIGDTVFFRNEKQQFILNPIKIKVLTSPAVYLHRVQDTKEQLSDSPKNIMKKRMRYILTVFANNNCKTIILGAFGCGVYKNKPKDISDNWFELLENEGYKKYFENIIFAINGSKRKNSNYDIFYQKLKTI